MELENKELGYLILGCEAEVGTHLGSTTRFRKRFVLRTHACSFLMKALGFKGEPKRLIGFNMPEVRLILIFN